MISPFPSGLAPGPARRQAAALLVLFYCLVYGGGIIFGGGHDRLAEPILSALVLGLLMLLVTGLFLRRDASTRESLGLGRQRVGSVVGWSLVGFFGTYVVNLVLISLYLSMQGNLETIAADRATWLGKLAEVRTGAILPLAAFAAIWEETVFRGFLLGRLRAAMPARETQGAALRRDVLAVGLTALFFGAGHGYQGGLGLVQTTVAGVALGGLAVWRNSLWPAIGAHLAIDSFGFLALKLLKPMLQSLTALR